MTLTNILLRAILVDDEAIILNELKEFMENEGMMVVGAYDDPLEALRELAETKPDCAFLDIEMPNMTGIELAERLVSADPSLTIIFLTAYNHYASQAFDVSAIDYLLKPIRPERLRKAIEKLPRIRSAEQFVRSDTCTIRCLGSFEVLMKGLPVKWGRSKSKEFLAYMLQHEGKWVTKFQLCEEMWFKYEPEQALAYLQTSVYCLRKNLRAAGCTQIEIVYADDRYKVNVRVAEWDLPAFEQAFKISVQPNTTGSAQQAISLYRGEYMEGEDWLWSNLHREYYAREYKKLLERHRNLS